MTKTTENEIASITFKRNIKLETSYDLPMQPIKVNVRFLSRHGNDNFAPRYQEATLFRCASILLAP